MKHLITKLALASFSAAALSACSGQVIPEDATTVDKAAVVGLKMEKQQVRRFDCDGKVISDKVEVVKTPTELVEIHPVRSSWTYGNIFDSDFRDKQTGSGPGIIYDKVKFTVDHGKGAFNMYVKSGINEITYRFDFSDGVIEEGSRFIDVHYSETLLDGVSEVHAMPEDCAAP